MRLALGLLIAAGQFATAQLPIDSQLAAEIAKIHTTEWTPQLLYDEPLYEGMNANWNGLLGEGGGDVSTILSDIVVSNFGKSQDVAKASQWYSVFASGPGIFGLGSKVPGYDISNPKYTNGGVNHFGSFV